MKKNYISPITEVSEIEILNMICESPGSDGDWWEQDDEGGINGDFGQARERCDAGFASQDFGSLW